MMMNKMLSIWKKVTLSNLLHPWNFYFQSEPAEDPFSTFVMFPDANMSLWGICLPLFSVGYNCILSEDISTVIWCCLEKILPECHIYWTACQRKQIIERCWIWKLCLWHIEMVSGFCNNRSDCRLDTKLYFLVPDGSESKCQSLIKWVNIIVSQKKSSGSVFWFFFLAVFFKFFCFFPSRFWFMILSPREFASSVNEGGSFVGCWPSASRSPHPGYQQEVQYWVLWFFQPST